jgi:AbrB family looped-hinge helix DNA binding protein
MANASVEITKVSSKGQLVIPLKIRSELGIDEGSVVAVERMNDMVVIKKIDVDLVRQFKNSLADIKAGKVRRVA